LTIKSLIQEVIMSCIIMATIVNVVSICVSKQQSLQHFICFDVYINGVKRIIFVMNIANVLSIALILFSVIDIVGNIPVIIDLKKKGS